MIELHPATVLLLVEALAVLGLTVVVWTVLAWLRRRRINAALASMVEMASADAAARGERNAASIGTALGVEGEALDTHVKAVERATRVVLKTVITSWSQRDTEAITALPEALEGLNAQWRELLTATGEATPAAAAEDPDQAAEIERLKAEKKTLEDELAITRDTVTRMLNEYAAMYERGDRKDDSTARRLLNGEKIEALAASAEDGPEHRYRATGGRGSGDTRRARGRLASRRTRARGQSEGQLHTPRIICVTGRATAGRADRPRYQR